MGKTVCITGSNGFVGRNLTSYLLKSGYKVIGLIRKGESHPIKDDNLTLIEADFEDYCNLYNILSAHNIDIMVHLAWNGYGKQTNDIDVQFSNVKYSIDLLKLSNKLGIKKFLFADSMHEYLKIRNNDGSLSLCSIYGSAKSCFNKLCSTYCFRNDIHFNGLLISNIFGEGDFSNRTINQFVTKMIKNEPLDLIPGEANYDWISINEAVKEILLVIEKGRNGRDYYIGSDSIKPFKEILIDAKKALDSNSQLNFGKYIDNSFIDFDSFDTKSIFCELGYKMHYSFEEEIIKLKEFLIQNKPENF